MERRPRPVLLANTIAGGISAVATAVFGGLVALGVVDLTAEQVGAVVAMIAAPLSLIATLVAAWYGQTQVTPLKNPVDAEGTSLVPITSLGESPHLL
jgi:hypothetical protein